MRQGEKLKRKSSSSDLR